jgi:RNA polymerase sigma factor (sigma-70 family)
MATGQLGTVLRHLHTLAVSPTTRDLTDVQLLERFRQDHDEAAFTALVKRHGRLVWGVCRHHLPSDADAEDAFQATFLVLARQAASIRKGGSLGCWLHGVAYRVAQRAKRDAARRRTHEQRAQNMPKPSSVPEAAWRDLQATLDEEVQRLPEKCRAPFVLCCLEGNSLADAAGQLGWKVGTVSGRVAQARKQLKQRLARRGVTFSAVLCAGELSRQAASAVVPAGLVRRTVRAALGIAAGGVSAPVAALVEGVRQAMFTTKSKLISLGLLAALCTLGAGLLIHQALADRPPAAPPPQKPAATKKAAKEPAAKPPKKGDALEVSGRVLDPAGNPVSGAALYLSHIGLKVKAAKPWARSDEKGRFRFTFSKSDVDSPLVEDAWRQTVVLAATKGYGPAVAKMASPEAAANLTLRLAKDDVPIRGRVLDLQARPVAGVTVRVDSLAVPKQADLSAWLTALQADKREGYQLEYKFLDRVNVFQPPELFPPVTTDAKGCFALKGLGRERVVGLILEGPTIETLRVNVRTRPGKTLDALPGRSFVAVRKLIYYGATFDHVAAPTQPIVGAVRDKDTGEPLAGVTVQSEKLAGSDLYGDSSLKTVTDKKGHYRLTGMPRGKGNILKALPGEGQPYHIAVRSVPGSPAGVGPVSADFALKRGVLVKGRVTDKATGRPVRGNVNYFVFADNPARKDVPGFATNPYLQTRPDGSFELVVLPGRGLIAVRGWADRWLVAVGAERIKGRDQQGFLPTLPHLCAPVHYHTLVEINPAKDAKTLECPVILDPGLTLKGTVLGPDNRPLAGARVHGLKSYYASGYWQNEPLPTAAFTVHGMRKDKPRNLIFLHEKKKLAGSLVVRGTEKGPLTVKLRPWSVVTGRLVDDGGQPLTGGELVILSGRKFFEEDLQVGSLPKNSFPVGKDGRFRIEGLLPGLKYSIAVSDGGNRLLGRLVNNLTVKSGETKDLGDVRIKPFQ